MVTNSQARRVSPSPFESTQLGNLSLRNRIVKAATYEGMTPGGMPSAALIEHHARLARGGVGLTTVAYCAVAPDGRTFAEQMVMERRTEGPLSELTAEVHAAGGAVSLQLGHCGFFTKNSQLSTWLPRGPSLCRNEYGVVVGKPLALPMNELDIQAVIDAFGGAAEGALRAGFDALEIHLGHGYLLSQFISPASNRRRDRWGGSLSNRLRLPLAVLRRVREVVGEGFPLIAKINLSDGFRGGLEVEEACGVARALEDQGVGAIELSGGFTSRSALFLLRGGRPLRHMVSVERNWLQRLALRFFGSYLIRAHPFEELFFLELARRVRESVQVPLILLGGVRSRENLQTAMEEGFEFVAMGRALLADPELVRRMEEGEASRSRCVSCNACIAEMDDGGIRCVLDGARPGGSRLREPLLDRPLASLPSGH